MKQIPLKGKYANGRFILVDDEDYEKISKSSWSILDKNNDYATATIDSKKVMLHRYLMDCPKGLCVDHINLDTLDNRKENLRICTHSENNRNKKPYGSTSKYKGVRKAGKKFRACIEQKNKGKRTRYSLGTFDTEVEAAAAYNAKAKELFGEFAYLNKI